MLLKLLSFIMVCLGFFVQPVAASSPEVEPLYDYQRDYLSDISYYPNRWTYDGDGLVVAVIDTGVWQSHPDLAGNIWNNSGDRPGNGIDDDRNGYVDDFYGWDFIYQTGVMSVLGTHGTSVASLIASELNEYGMAGLAPKVKIMSLIACSDDYGCPASSVTSALYYAVDNGADIINLSLGTNGYLAYSTDYNDAIEYVYDHNVVIVASAGNGDVESAGTIGQDLDYMPVSPVCNDGRDYNMVLGVGASDANWSNYGDCVDIEAPGVDIVVATVPSLDNGYYYTYESGTSFSAPLVVGAIALLKDKHPDWENFEIIDHVIETSFRDELNVKDLIDNDLTLPIVNTISPTTVEAGSVVTITGQHFTSQYDLHLIAESGEYTEFRPSKISIVNSQLMRVTLDNSLSSGRYWLQFEGSNNRSSVFSISNSSISNVSEEEIDTSNVDTNLAAYVPARRDDSLVKRLLGYILIQAQEQGQAWYVNPFDAIRYYMKNGDVAYEMMRSFGLGITDSDLGKIPSVDTQDEMPGMVSVCSTNSLANSVRGKILLQVQQHGEAWYVHPEKCYRIYMKNGVAAYTIMRYLSLGISKSDLEKMPSGDIE